MKMLVVSLTIRCIFLGGDHELEQMDNPHFPFWQESNLIDES